VPVLDAPTPLHGPLAALGPVRLEPVRADAAAVAQWNAAVARWHPLGYQGACYRAVGWDFLGETSGSGLARPGRTYHSSPRQVWVKPLCAQWHERLCATAGGATP